MIKIKPCPFCGGKGISEQMDDDIILWRVNCQECFTFGPETTSEKTAILLWNNRI